MHYTIFNKNKFSYLSCIICYFKQNSFLNLFNLFCFLTIFIFQYSYFLWKILNESYIYDLLFENTKWYYHLRYNYILFYLRVRLKFTTKLNLMHMRILNRNHKICVSHSIMYWTLKIFNFAKIYTKIKYFLLIIYIWSNGYSFEEKYILISIKEYNIGGNHIFTCLMCDNNILKIRKIFFVFPTK